MMEKTIAEQLHAGYQIIDKVEMIICEVFEKYEPEIYKSGFDFEICSDSYDNSIEIYFKSEMPSYPWEPNIQIRREIYNLGFSCVYWNFQYDKKLPMWELNTKKMGKFNFDQSEEIRGFEPRRYKNFKPKDLGLGLGYGHIYYSGIGYVDDRFNEKEWVGSVNDCRLLQKELWSKKS